MQTIKIIEHDIIYLSYDEPNADQNYADLLTKVPWAKRVHGVKGSDAAHKACANIAETERFVTVDGDNQIYDDFINNEIEVEDDVNLSKSVISWCGKNVINGLTYGNGGLKCWPKDFVLGMKTHENAEPDNPHAQVDFCWDINYIQQNSTYSDVHNNATKHQAWRAGFREGVKMALDRGVRVNKNELLATHWKNLHRLYIWTMVGADAINGVWAILGARAGLVKTMCTDWDYIQVRDFEHLNAIWREEFEQLTDDQALELCETLGETLVDDLEIPIDQKILSPKQSKFFKTVYINPSRTHS
jgi:hypothetical protein